MTPPKPRTPPRVCGGVFQPDPTIPPDQSGRATCRCQLVGEPGDAHHTLLDTPVRDVQLLRAGEDGGER